MNTSQPAGVFRRLLNGLYDFSGALAWLFSPPLRRLAELLALTSGTIFVGYMAWSTCAYVIDSYRFGDMAGGLIAIPIWIPQLSFIVGAILLFTAMLDELIRVAYGRRPIYVVAVEQRHAHGDFREDL